MSGGVRVCKRLAENDNVDIYPGPDCCETILRSPLSTQAVEHILIVYLGAHIHTPMQADP